MKTNNQLQTLIGDLKSLSRKEGVKLWSRIANDLEKATSQRRIVNLSKLAHYTKENEQLIVPGKVLAGGDLSHKVTVAAFSFSKGAKERIEKLQGKALSIPEMMKENPKGQKVRIIG